MRILEVIDDVVIAMTRAIVSQKRIAGAGDRSMLICIVRWRRCRQIGGCASRRHLLHSMKGIMGSEWEHVAPLHVIYVTLGIFRTLRNVLM